MPPDLKVVRNRILRLEEQYPEFRNCELVNDVAMIYGWGDPVTAWLKYCDLKEMLYVASSR
jgi:hypothetical protein